MSNIDLAINNPEAGQQGQHKVSHTHASEPGQESPPVDFMALAYYELVKAATTLSETALIQSKQLQGNGQAQKQLNYEAEGLQWYYEPKMNSTHHTAYIPHSHWNWNPMKHGGIGWWTSYQKVTNTTHKNQVTVTRAQAKNQQVSAERQFLTQKMGLLQQEASVGETGVNTTNNNSAETLQMSSMFMQIVQSLTFKAMLTRQPQTS